MQNEFDLEKIEAYLFGQISTSDAALIEEKILTDSNFAHQVRVLEAVVNGVRLNSIQIIANKLENSKQSNNFEELLDDIEKECEDNVAKSIKKTVNLNALKLERERVVKYMDSSLSAKAFEKIESEKALTYSTNKVGRSNLKKFLYISAVAALIFVIILVIPFSITSNNERIAIIETPKTEEQPKFDTKDPNKENTKTNENKFKAKADPRFTIVLVPSEYNSKDNPYVLPETAPIDAKTGKPYADTVGQIEFMKADEIAKTADGRKIYWDNGKLKAYKNEPIATIEPRFAIVPETYNSDENTFVLPKTVPNDTKTGKPYAANTDEFEAFTESNDVAMRGDDRRVYWDNGVLKAYKEPVAVVEEPKIDPRFVIVPPQYNSLDNTYRLPKAVSNDPKTGKPFLKGTPVYKAYEDAVAVAKKSSNGNVFWDGDVLAFVPDATVAIAPTGQSFKVQVAAMENLNTKKYEELTAGELAEYSVVYEKNQDGITRVVIVPKAKNEDETYGFKNKEDALKVLKLVIEGTSFTSSFVGIYEGNKRLEGLIRLDNQIKSR
jgi:hypothetical protein